MNDTLDQPPGPSRGATYRDRNNDLWHVTELLPGQMALIRTEGTSQEAALFETVAAHVGPLTLVEDTETGERRG